ncbi:hypothetical protein EI94DRAFT_1706485 [Lactarius quietus]|nr:hypothetical protein EI94DRAFT_1706485 [Lactarius quietus]
MEPLHDITQGCIFAVIKKSHQNLSSLTVQHCMLSSSNVQRSSSAPILAPNFQPIFDDALKRYKKKTGKDLTTHPLAKEIRNCGSPDDIVTVLQKKADALNQSQSGDERLTKWLTPTVNVLNLLSATVGQGVGTVFPPIETIFSGVNILLVATRDTAAQRDVLIELFDKIEGFFVRLQTYTEATPTTAMRNEMGKIVVEVLCMLAIMTNVMKQGRKLIGRNDVEDALQRLEKLEQGELRTVNAEVFKTTSDIKDVATGLKATTSDIKDYAEGTSKMVKQIVSSHKCSHCLPHHECR